MAVDGLTNAEVTALAGTRDGLSGVEFHTHSETDYFYRMVETQWLLSLASANWFQVLDDDAAALTVRVMPGRAVLAGETLVYAGGTVAGLTDNDTTYIWLYDSGGGVAAISSAIDATGWPTYAHFKLAEVTVDSGAVTAILDRSREHKLGLSLWEVPRYSMTISSQGDTGTASEVTITLEDSGGNALAVVDYLRVRVIEDDGYADSANATIAAGTNTTVVETMTATKDLVLKSHTDGTFKVDLTDASAETVSLAIGPAPIRGRRADYTTIIDVTHAAP